MKKNELCLRTNGPGQVLCVARWRAGDQTQQSTRGFLHVTSHEEHPCSPPPPLQRVLLRWANGALWEYVMVHTILGGSPAILWISLGGKPKWLPLKFGYYDVIRTSPIFKTPNYFQLSVLYLKSCICMSHFSRALTGHKVVSWTTKEGIWFAKNDAFRTTVRHSGYSTADYYHPEFEDGHSGLSSFASLHNSLRSVNALKKFCHQYPILHRTSSFWSLAACLQSRRLNLATTQPCDTVVDWKKIGNGCFAKIPATLSDPRGIYSGD